MVNLISSLALCLAFLILMVVIPGVLTGLLVMSLLGRRKPRARQSADSLERATASNH